MTIHRARTSLAVLAALAVAAAGAASAQPKPEGRAGALQRLTDCRKITDGAERLACYDAAAAAFESAEAKGDVVVVDREQAREVRRQGFGFQIPSLAMFEKGESKEEVENVTGQVASARMNGAGKWVVQLEGGAVWLQIDTNELSFGPKPGDPVKIRRATLGSYLMSVKGQRAFRVKRQE
ncbi:hypothetical protein [Phenylobacterium sp.]|uniref:hypothetical protein n=1 Tax=Phenylobacterium sp. TaxID=1871053 RepID=UPI0035B2EC10